MILERYDDLDLGAYRRIVVGGELVQVSESLYRHVDARREAMLAHLATGVSAYGVNTGLGHLASVPVAPEDRPALDRSLLTARASGLGPPLPQDVVRGALLLRLVGFLSGYPGVSATLCRFLAERLNDGWGPVVPWGPYGASGEIGPLAHLFQTLIGEGLVEIGGDVLPAREALAGCGAEPYELGPKEGVALINGSPLATALTVHCGDRCRRLLDQATLAAALAAALLDVSTRPYSARLGSLSRDPAGERVRERLLALLEGGPAWEDKLQAPVSLRVTPEVHGALLGALDELEDEAARRLGAVTDSPLYLAAEDGEPEGFYPSGAFHAAWPTLRLETVAVAVSHVTSLVEKRLHRLLDSRFSDLPEQLAPEPGKQAGAASLHKAVVGLAVENRLFASPASVHAIDTSTGQEDVQAFTLLAAERLERALDNLEWALACELVALRQATHLRGRPPAAPRLALAVERLADVVPPIAEDRTLSPDVQRVRALLLADAL